MQIKITEEDIKWYIKTAPLFGKVLHTIAKNLTQSKHKSPKDTLQHFIKETHIVMGHEVSFPFGKVKNSIGEEFKYPLCISIDECIGHGQHPYDSLKINNYKQGDVIKIDGGVSMKAPSGRNMYFDSALTIVFGGVPKKENLNPLIVAPAMAIEEMLDLRGVINTKQLSEIIQSLGEQFNYNIVNALCGHSIGYKLHDGISITNLVSQAASENLLPGTFICPEPMYVDNGSGDIANCYIDSDGWSVVCEDISSHWETVLYYDGNKLIDVVGIISPK